MSGMYEYRTRAIISRSWLEAALEYKPYIRTEFSEKNLLKNKEMVFGNGIKNIQAAAYNGARLSLNQFSKAGNRL